MAVILRQSTQIEVRVGPFVDVGDGFTPEVAVTLSGADEAELLKSNGAATASISAATWSAVTGCDGWYDLTLTTSHTDTVGELIVVVQDASVCLPVFARFQVIEEATYDALFGASATGFDANGRVDVGEWLGTACAAPTVAGVPEVDVTHMAGGTQTVTDLKDFADAGYNPATNKVQGVVLVDTTTTNTDMRGTENAALASVCTVGRLSELDGANLPADVAANGSAIAALNDIDGATVNAEVDTALADIGLDHLTSNGTAVPAVTAGTYLDQIMDDGTAVFNRTTDSLQSIRDSAALATVCTEGRLAELDAGNLPTDVAANASAISGLNNVSSADVNAACDTALTDYDGPTKAELDSGLAGMNDLDAAAVNAEVVDVMRTDTVSEIAAVPAANAPLHTMLQWLYSLARNKRTTTAIADTLRNDADGADIGSSTISDNGTTFTRTKYT